MKTIIRYSTFALAAAFLLTGCMDKENALTEFGGEKVPFSFCVDNVTLKSTYNELYQLCWDDQNDKVGIFIGTGTSNAQASISRGDDGTAVFTAEVSPYQAGDMVYGYYPYSESVSNASEAALEIPAVQYQAEETKFNGAYNPLIVRPIALESGSDAAGSKQVILQFYQTAAVAEFDVYSSNTAYVGEQVKSITFKAEGVSGTFSADLTSGNPGAVQMKTSSNEVTVLLNKFVLVSAAEKERLIYLAMVPGTYTGELVLTTDRATYTYAGQEINYERASCKRYKLDLDRGTREVKNTGIYEWNVTQGDLNAMINGPKSVGSPAMYWYLNGSNYCFDAADTEAQRGASIGNTSKLTDMTLSTVDYKGLIKAVVVNAAVSNRNGKTKAELTVSVNGTAIETKTIETYGYSDGAEGQTAGQPVDYVFKLAQPVENGKIDVHYKLVTCEQGSPNGMYLKSIQVLDKDFEVEEISVDEKQAKWSLTYCTFNEVGFNNGDGKKLWDGVTSTAAFQSHNHGNRMSGLGYAYVVIDLGEPTTIASIGCHVGLSTANWAEVSKTEFFMCDAELLTPGIVDDWKYINNNHHTEGTAETHTGYKTAHAKMTEYEAHVNWNSLGLRSDVSWYWHREYRAHVPYNKIGVLPKARYIKVQLNSWYGWDSKRGVISEIYVSKVKSVDGQPL